MAGSPIALLGLLAQLVTAAQVSLTLQGTEPVSSTDARYRCFNIDTSSNRQFFEIDFAQPRLRYLAAALGPGGYLRVGGTGNDHLTYQFGGTPCDRSGGGACGKHAVGNCCLNQSQWDALCGLAAAAEVPMVFGLNLMQRQNASGSDRAGHWDPANARQLLEYSIETGCRIYGLELGNEEQDKLGSTIEASARRLAQDYLVLQALLEELYPVQSSRPRLYGPDPTSLGNPGGCQIPSSTHLIACVASGYPGDPLDRYDAPILSFLTLFTAAAKELGVDLAGITYHEVLLVLLLYVGLTGRLHSILKLISRPLDRPTSWTQQQSSRRALLLQFELSTPLLISGLERSGHTMVATRHAPASASATALLLTCSGAKALHGHQVFCRQDLVGADYGMLDCATHLPNPDYYIGLLWSRTMGRRILNLTSSDTGRVRSYAACAARGITVLLINLRPEYASVELPMLLHASRHEDYVLTGHLESQGVKLNNVTLLFMGDRLPPMPPVDSKAGAMFTLPGESVAFVSFPEAHLPGCAEREVELTIRP